MNEDNSWLDWNAALRLLRAGGVGSMPWNVLSEWCASELVASKAATITGVGPVAHDADIDAEFWKLTRTLGGSLSAIDGSISARGKDDKGGSIFVSVISPRFKKSQLLSLLPHVSPALLAEVEAGEGPSFVRRSLPSMPIPKDSAGIPTGDPGRPSLGNEFYMAELERRRVAGLTEKALADEAQALKDWFKAEHPMAQQPTRGTIENRIRQRFNSAKLAAK